jgi:7-keto-8-aminopelargonate synthetase-like enzyme
MAAALRGEGVFAVAIRPPTVPAGQARIRASVMATHNASDVELALRAFAAAARAVGLLPGSAGLR